MDVVAPSYGVDKAGLICGFLFRPGCTATAVTSTEAAAWLATLGQRETGSDDQDFLWLHFNLSHSAAERWLHQHVELSDTFFETLKDGIHSTRIEQSEQALIAVVNDVHFDFSFEPSDISTLW